MAVRRGLRVLLLHDPPPAHGQLTLGGQQASSQRCAGPEESADETQEIAGHFADASQAAPEALEEVDDGTHAPLTADEASKRKSS
jgi:hypothetical protein